jgi:hypothetical protein
MTEEPFLLFALVISFFLKYLFPFFDQQAERERMVLDIKVKLQVNIGFILIAPKAVVNCGNYARNF